MDWSIKKAAWSVFQQQSFGVNVLKISFLILPLIILCSGCASTNTLGIKQHNLPYWQKLTKRDTSDLNLIVVHATELPDLKIAREYGERILYESGTGASGHYYIDRDGYIEQYVPDNRIANHTSGWNKKSLSIELVNIGRHPEPYQSDHQVMKEPYPQKQIDRLIELMTEFKLRYPTIKFIQGHEDLDRRKVPATDNPEIYVERKRDPGPYFPWVEVLERINLIKAIPP